MIQQWVYSYSCWNRRKRATDSVSRGFGSFSWSDGLSMADIEELERRCSGYELPSWASTRPGEEEKRRLPFAFYSFTLASGKRAIVKTQYIGEGFYDQRWGATISHGMILPQGDWPGYPAEWMDSPVFWRELPESIRNEALVHKNNVNRPDPDLLPVLADSDFRPSGNYSVEQVLKHFENDSSRDLLVRLFSLWGRATQHPSCVFFNSPDEESSWLLAGFSMLFPMEWTKDIPFSTRLFSPMPLDADRSRWYEIAAGDPRKAKLSLTEYSVDKDAESLVSAVVFDREGFFEFIQGFSETSIRDWKSLLLLYRLVYGPALDGTPERLTDGLEFLRAHGNRATRFICLKGILDNGAIIPATLSRTWIEALVSLCDGDSSAETIVVRLFLSYRERFSATEALDCFLSFCRHHIGDVARIWLEEFASADRSTLGVRFTIVAAVQSGNCQNPLQNVTEALEGVEAGPDLDWLIVLSFAAVSFPEALPAVISKCPDERAVVAFVARTAPTPLEAVRIASQMLSCGTDGQAERILLSFLDGHRENRSSHFIQLFDNLSLGNELFAKTFYMDAFRHEFSSDSRLEWTPGEWEWFARKHEEGFVPSQDNDKYWQVVERNAPFEPDAVWHIMPALKSFLEKKPTDAQRTRSDFYYWAANVLHNAWDEFPLSDLSEYSPIYSELDAAVRKCWIGRLLPALYMRISDSLGEGQIPISYNQHKAMIHFFANGLEKRESVIVAELYAGTAASDWSRHTAKHIPPAFLRHILPWLGRRDTQPTENRFGGLLRLCLHPDQDVAFVTSLRQALAMKTFIKLSPAEMKCIKETTSLSNLSPEEERGLQLMSEEIEGLKERRNFAGRFLRFIFGKECC